MEAGHCGLSGPTVQLNVTLVFNFENVSAIHLHQCMVAVNARVHTFRPETATPTPAQVLLRLQLPQLIMRNTATTSILGMFLNQRVCFPRCVSTGDDVHDSSWMWGTGWCVSTCVFGHDCLRGAVHHLLLWWLLLCPRLLPAQQKLYTSVSLSVLPPGGGVWC